MNAQSPTARGREVVAIFLDVDDATAGLTDLALPSTVLPHASTSYTPPQTRLEVMREALVAFVGAKLRSLPSASLLSFSLYAVTTTSSSAAAVAGQDSDDEVAVHELLASASAGAAGGRALQAAIKQVTGSAVTLKAPQQGGAASASPAVYTAVVRKLELLRREAERTHAPTLQRDSPPVSTNNSFAAVRSGAPRSLGTSFHGEAALFTGGVAASTAAVVAHGILLRSRQTALSATLAQAASTRNATGLNGAAPTSIALGGLEGLPRCWLDIVSLATLDEPAVPRQTPTTPNLLESPLLQDSPMLSGNYPHDPLTVNGKPFTDATSTYRSSEVLLGDGTCACAVLDPVELTGITHRGLALGPSLVRLISLQERRTPAFVRRPLVFLDIPAAAPTPRRGPKGPTPGTVDAAGTSRDGNGSEASAAAIAYSSAAATPPLLAQTRSSQLKQTGSSGTASPLESGSGAAGTAPTTLSPAVVASESLSRIALPQLFSIIVAASPSAPAISSVGGNTPIHSLTDPHELPQQNQRRSSNHPRPVSLPAMQPPLSNARPAAATNRPPPMQPPVGAYTRKPSVKASAPSPPVSSSLPTSISNAVISAGVKFFGSPSDPSAMERRGNGGVDDSGGEYDRAVALRYSETTTSTPNASPTTTDLVSPPLTLRRATTAAASQRGGQSPVTDAVVHPPQPPVYRQQRLQLQPRALDRGRSGGARAGVVAVPPEQPQPMPMPTFKRLSLPPSTERQMQQQQQQQQQQQLLSPHPPGSGTGGANTSSGVRSNLAYRGTILGNRAPHPTTRALSPSRSSNGSGPQP